MMLWPPSKEIAIATPTRLPLDVESTATMSAVDPQAIPSAKLSGPAKEDIQPVGRDVKVEKQHLVAKGQPQCNQ